MSKDACRFSESNICFVTCIFMLFFFLSIRRCDAVEQLAPRMPVPAAPIAVIPPCSKEPIIDGDDSDPCWQDAAVLGPFSLSYQSAFAPYHAEALVTYSTSHLYVCIRTFDYEDPATIPPIPPPNDPVVAEVLIAAGQPERFYKVAVNNRDEINTKQPMGHALPWRQAPQAFMKRHKDHWVAEFAIPFDGTHLPNPATTSSLSFRKWRMNFGWRTATRTNYSAWAVTHAWFYEPQFFGEVIFGDVEHCRAYLLKPHPACYGKNPLMLRVHNSSNQNQTCEISLLLEDNQNCRRVFCEKIVIPPHSHKETVAYYELTDGIRGVATIEIRRGSEAIPFFRQSVIVDLPPIMQLLHDIDTCLSRITKNKTKLSESLWYMYRECKRSLNQIQKTLEKAGHSHKSWVENEPTLRELHAKTKKLQWITQYDSILHKHKFALGTHHSLEKMVHTLPYLHPPSDLIEVSGARGEVENAQIIVIPLGENVSNLQFSISPLQGPNNNVIPSENVSVFWEGFVAARPARYPTPYLCEYADPLIPLSHAPRDIDKNIIHQPFWVCIKIPYKILAGIYTGKINITASGDSQEITLRVRVFDFDLLKRPTLKTSMWLNPERITSWYGWTTIPQEIMRRQNAFLLDHRLNPCWFGPIGDETEVTWQLEQGLNCAMLGVADRLPLPPEREQQIDKWYKFFRERGLLEMAFIYAQDEPSPQDYPSVRETMHYVAQRWHGVKRMCTAFPPVPELEGAVDIWVVGPNLFNYDAVAERLRHGDELWIYLSASVRRPYAMQLYLDYTALEHRLIGWYCWKYGATGFLYWGINEWETNRVPWSGKPEIDNPIRNGKRWPEVPWNSWTYLDCNGEAQYIYPGPDGDFWSSVRLEILRDSFEDYEYLHILDKLRQELETKQEVYDKDDLLREAMKLSQLTPPFISDLTTATSNPQDIFKRRLAIAECIEKIKTALYGEN